MVRGPSFEGRRYDKKALRETGASVVGMSLLPEACIAALYHPRVKALAIAFITNNATDKHSHETNQQKAKENREHMGRVLHGIIRHLPTNP